MIIACFFRDSSTASPCIPNNHLGATRCHRGEADSLIFSNVLFQNQEFVSGIHSRPGANIQEVILDLNFGLVGQPEYVIRACLVYWSAKRQTFASWNRFYMVALFKWITPAAIKKWCFLQSKPKSWTPPKACPNRRSLQLTGSPHKGVQFGQCVPILYLGESWIWTSLGAIWLHRLSTVISRGSDKSKENSQSSQ